MASSSNRRNHIGRRPQWIFLVTALVVASGYVAFLKPWTPIFDEVEYLAYGRSLALAGVFASTPDGPEKDAGPGREPVYPALIATVARLDARLYQTLATCWPYEPACGRHLTDLRYANAVFIAVAAWLVFLTVRTLGHGALAAWVAGGYVLFNIQMNKTATHVISDYVALALCALLGLTLTKAAADRSAGWWGAVGLALATLVLTKNIFVIFGGVLVAGLIFAAVRHRSPFRFRAWLPVLLVIVAFGVPVGTWHARNLALFGAGNDARGAYALSTREVFNDMSAGENAAAFVWWTRGFGEKLARRLLPEPWWHRHELYVDDGFYMQGQVHRYQARVAREMERTNGSRAQAEAAMSGIILSEMLGQWPSYIATTPALFYRGLWFDEFIVFGFPALMWLLIRSARRVDRRTLLALGGGMFSLIIYPLLSLNIPRYQFTAAPALAIAAGIAVEMAVLRWRARNATLLRL
jgi:4-amino-4-deoxy-L-arabinose transferase-like glycosyltransferase